MAGQLGSNEITSSVLGFSIQYQSIIGDLVSKETVCCVGGKVKH